MTSHPTVIETERLILRPHRLEDEENVARLWADPQVVRFICQPSTRQESWSRLLRYAGHWGFFGYGYFAVEERAVRPLHRRCRRGSAAA